jgi:hypothetical protein
MMYQVEYMVRQEQCRDLLREAERERLIRSAGRGRGHGQRAHRDTVRWMGTHLVRWGELLLHSEVTLSGSESVTR